MTEIERLRQLNAELLETLRQFEVICSEQLALPMGDRAWGFSLSTIWKVSEEMRLRAKDQP